MRESSYEVTPSKAERGPGTADESLTGQPERASADSEVRPDPGRPHPCPHHRKTVQAGPEALSTSSLPNRRGLWDEGFDVGDLYRTQRYAWQ